MDAAASASLDRRLARVEGQIAGLRRMVQEDRYCLDILTQLSAAKSALSQAGAELLASHLKSCILGEHAHPAACGRSQEDLVEELKDALSRLA